MACGHRIRTSWKSFYLSFGFWWIRTLFIASTWFNTVGPIIFVPYLWQGIVLGTEDTGKYKTKTCPLGVWYSTGGYKKYTSQVIDVWHDRQKNNWIRKWKPTRGVFSLGWQGMESEEWPLPKRTAWSLWLPRRRVQYRGNSKAKALRWKWVSQEQWRPVQERKEAKGRVEEKGVRKIAEILEGPRGS